MAERYKPTEALLEALRGGELEGVYRSAKGDPIFPTVDVILLNVGTEHNIAVPAELLTPVKPPTPPEPELGAYLIGGVIAVRWRAPEGFVEWSWQWRNANGDEDWTSDTWDNVWKYLGGPDVTITRLVPERVETVELPWRHSDNDGDRVTVTLGGNVDVNGDIVVLTGPARREMAAALLAASRAES